MSIMQQSSKAQDRALGVWFNHIQQGMIKLPRFQRFEAWDRSRIASFLNTVIDNLPVGVTLALEVAGKEKFVSRYIATSDKGNAGPVTQHLLDGQQRLTAFWRAMHNNYDLESFYVYLPQFEQGADKAGSEVEIRCVPRWHNKAGSRMPLWADQPAKCLERGLIPVDLLRPEDISKEIENWLSIATKPLEPTDTEPDALAKFKAYSVLKDTIKSEITILRERVKHFNLPYLSLPADTSKAVALQVFINMNTNSKPLSLYDIIVAEVESVAEKSLHELQDNLKSKCDKAGRYGNISDLILATSALMQEKLPNTRGMIEMDKRQLLQNWSKLERGLKLMASFLEGQRIFDAARLPTNVVLPVIAASYEWIPDDGDKLAKAEKLLRRYLWTAFFTDRYENTTTSRAFADFKAIKTLLIEDDFTEDALKMVPMLNQDEYPLADADSLIAAGWPKGNGIEARAILAVGNYFGANDFADNRPATYDTLQKREYHHIFPEALLAEAGLQGNLALNCALINWKTNRIIGRKDPLEYLKDRVDCSDLVDVETRLKSHLISYSLLSKAKYSTLDGSALKSKLETDFNEFLRDRANLVVAAVQYLTEGNKPSLDNLYAQHCGQHALDVKSVG